MISHEHRCIFIHIPKCGGTSIEESLGYHRLGLRRGGQDHRRLVSIQRAIWPPKYGVYHPAEFARFVKQRRFSTKRNYTIINRSQFDSYFKFTIVRNPWDRAHSWYRNVVRDPLHRKAFGVQEDCTFAEFMRANLNCWALDPQLDWLKDRGGNQAMDYIGRFETLNESYDEVRRSLKLEPVVLKKLLHSEASDYRRDYTDELRELVAKKYAEEIAEFSYSFD